MATSELSGAYRASYAASRWSVVLASGRSQSAEAPEAMTQLCQAFWQPIYGYLRQRGYSVDQARYALQEFFGDLRDKRTGTPAERPQGRLRVFVRSCLQNFLATTDRHTAARDRSGGTEMVPLPARAQIEMEIERPPLASNAFDAFDIAWARVVFDRALERLQSEAELRGRRDFLVELEMFLTGEFLEIDRQRVGVIASRLGMSVLRTRTAISRLRQRFREYLREEVAGTIPHPGELDDELQFLRRMRQLAPERNGTHEQAEPS
ncbi:hypothetical protein AYO41_03410 [Verrucomicrobia bacterium SCGC AG-212-E04]|nr:hypothetical protein AYO41_03410 [Verrucomicrobia bacterium SCGC AG-212-E04]